MNHYFNNFDKKFIFKLSCYIDKNLPTKRKSKYSSRYYIENILYVLKTGIQWSYLKCDSHYSSVYKKFSYWVNLNIFLKFYTDNFIHNHYHNNTTYNSIGNNININYNNLYTLIFDNMQCNVENVNNIKMLLRNNNINIYLPFILCCENIRTNCENDEDLINIKCTNIKGSYKNLRDKLVAKGFEVFECDFYEADNMTLKEEYKQESLLIGFDYITNKMITFKDFKKFNNKPKTINQINTLKTFLMNSQHNNQQFYNNIGIQVINAINELQQSNYVYNTNNKIKFNTVKALIYSMKEMRDWYYIKEIVKRNNEAKFNDIIYCTSDSINLFRAILYNISSINIHNNHIKYVSLFTNHNNNKYIIYKQISPGYNFSTIFNDVKQTIFNIINDTNTTIITKELIGGMPVISYAKTKNKKYNLVCISTNYMQIRLDIFELFTQLQFIISCFSDDSKIIYNNIKNNITIHENTIKLIKDFYMYIEKLHKFCDSHTIDILKCIDYKCTTLCDNEKNYIDKYYGSNYNTYAERLDNFNCRFIKDIEKYVDKLNTSKFYNNDEHKLSSSDFLYTLIFSYILTTSISEEDREYVGYILKMILNKYEYDLLRNTLFIFYDEYLYNDLIRGKRKIINTFDTNKYDYIDDIVTNNLYDDNLNKELTEIFEKKISSKYDDIINIIKN